MILGISSFTYGWSIGVEGNLPSKPMREEDLLKKVLDFNLKCLQIGDNLPLHQFSKSRLNNLKVTSNQHNIRLEVGARKLTAEHLNSYIEIATFLNAPLLRFVIDGDGYEPEFETIINTIINAIPALEESNITLGIENHDRLKARELAEIIKAVNHPNVGICLDCVNSMGAGEGFESVLDTLAPYTVNLHIKDFRIQRLPHKQGFTVSGAIAGKGMTDIPRLLEKILPYNRCQSAIFEQWVEPEINIEETVKKEHHWAEIGVAYLKGLSQLKFKHLIH